MTTKIDLMYKEVIMYKEVKHQMEFAIEENDWEKVKILADLNFSCNKMWGSDWEEDEIVLISERVLEEYAYTYFMDKYKLNIEVMEYINLDKVVDKIKSSGAYVEFGEGTGNIYWSPDWV